MKEAGKKVVTTSLNESLHVFNVFAIKLKFTPQYKSSGQNAKILIHENYLVNIFQL